MGIWRLALVYLLIGVTNSFPLVCSTDDVCTCFEDSIYCNGNRSTDVSAFNISAQHVDISHISLSYYNIRVLKNNTFSSLQGHTNDMLRMDISHNNISDMEDDCFKGLENNIYSLDLESNNLEAIPMAIASLNRISELSLMFNPLHVLDPTVLWRLGRRLYTLRLTLEHVQSWPYGLRFLYGLNSLYISKYNSTRIKMSDFYYMMNMHLHTLAISNSPLEELPVGICNIDDLRYLDISKNSFTYRTQDFVYACYTPKPKLIDLNMEGNHFDVLPDIGKAFPAIRSLDFSHNNLRYISSELTPMPALEHLSLDSNNMVHFPPALSSLVPNVKTLYLHKNRIVDIGNADLIVFANLQNIFFDDNPLEYIAASSFVRNTVLGQIGLRSTNLLTVPCALSSITSSSRRVYVHLTDSTLECDCRMSCLSNINMTHISFSGNTKCTQPNILVTEFITNVVKANVCPKK